jgi:hypothetical protein
VLQCAPKLYGGIEQNANLPQVARIRIFRFVWRSAQLIREPHTVESLQRTPDIHLRRHAFGRQLVGTILFGDIRDDLPVAKIVRIRNGLDPFEKSAEPVSLISRRAFLNLID